MNAKTKEFVYLVLWIITGILFGILLAGLIELFSYWDQSQLSLTFVLYGIMITFGIFIGLVAGPLAWKMIYIDGKRGQKYVVKDDK